MLLGSSSSRKEPESLRPTILEAFATAKERKSDWRTMRLPVLKNRLLELTRGEFDEKDYGWPNLRFLSEAFPDLLEFSPIDIHGAVSLVGEQDLPTPHVPETHSAAALADRATLDNEASGGTAPIAHVDGKIRPDLWDAVVDYASGDTYVWDTSKCLALKTAATDTRPRFPTISSDDVHRWRTAAASEWSQRNPDSAEIADAWVEDPRTPVPSSLRTAWNGFQKSSVLKILDGFFDNHQLERPANVVASKDRRSGSGHVDAKHVAMRAIEIMTDDELDSLQLPVRVVLRVLEDLRRGA